MSPLYWLASELGWGDPAGTFDPAVVCKNLEWVPY
jgi:hypothetical protein